MYPEDEIEFDDNEARPGHLTHDEMAAVFFPTPEKPAPKRKRNKRRKKRRKKPCDTNKPTDAAQAADAARRDAFELAKAVLADSSRKTDVEGRLKAFERRLEAKEDALDERADDLDRHVADLRRHVDRCFDASKQALLNQGEDLRRLRKAFRRGMPCECAHITWEKMAFLIVTIITVLTLSGFLVAQLSAWM